LTAGFLAGDGVGALLLAAGTIGADLAVSLSAVEDVGLGSVSGTAVTVVSTAGAITDGGGSAEVDADTLALSASTGIGAPGAIPTTVSALEARTISGGIAVANTGDLTIGGVDAALTGVSADSGGNVAISADSISVLETVSAISFGAIDLTA